MKKITTSVKQRLNKSFDASFRAEEEEVNVRKFTLGEETSAELPSPPPPARLTSENDFSSGSRGSLKFALKGSLKFGSQRLFKKKKKSDTSSNHRNSKTVSYTSKMELGIDDIEVFPTGSVKDGEIASVSFTELDDEEQETEIKRRGFLDTCRKNSLEDKDKLEDALKFLRNKSAAKENQETTPKTPDVKDDKLNI